MKQPVLSLFVALCCLASFIPVDPSLKRTAPSTGPVLQIQRCADFVLNGIGDEPAWQATAWSLLTKLDSGGRKYTTKCRMMYSTSGIYLSFTGDDDLITTRLYKDYENIFDGDVFEVFFHPDTARPVYFEYEINPLEKQLALSIARVGNKSLSWMPWNPDMPAMIRRKVHVNGSSSPKPGDAIHGWSAEIFFPYVVLGLLPDTPPKPGTRWDANFCRIDYDSGKMMLYSWSPNIQTSFHELGHYGTIEFE